MANSFVVMSSCYIGMTRVMLAMALDRVMPEWISRVHPKLLSPVNAYIAYLIGGIIWTFAYFYVPHWSSYTLGVTFAGGYVFTFSALAGALFPYRAKDIYNTSPGAKYNLFGIPLVTIVGILAVITGGGMTLSFLIFKQYGLTGTEPYIIVAGIIVISIVWFLVAKNRQRVRGIDISNAFREIPPE